jgi:hypothetical protein
MNLIARSFTLIEKFKRLLSLIYLYFFTLLTQNCVMKQTIFTTLLSITFLFIACKETPKTADTAATTTEKAVDSITNRGLDVAPVPTVAPDSLVVTVDSTGKVMIGKLEVQDINKLTQMLVDSSNALKKTFGKAPKVITCKSNGALMGIRGAIRDAIEDANEILKKGQ